MLQSRLVLLSLLSLLAPGTARTALFLLGDSSSALLYARGLAPLLECSVNDTAAVLQTELVYKYTTPALVCADGRVSRIGFAFHWGVAHDKYYYSWVHHKAVGFGNDSVENVLLAADEFLRRSASDDRTVLVFLSNYWDALRLHRHFISTSELRAGLEGYRRNFSAVVSALQAKLNTARGDALVLQTAHAPSPAWWGSSIVPLLNMEVAALSRHCGAPPLFRADISAGLLPVLPKDQATYLMDAQHQNDDASLRMAHDLLELALHNAAPTAACHSHRALD